MEGFEIELKCQVNKEESIVCTQCVKHTRP